MDFTVTILGSGSAIPTTRRNPTSQYVQCCNRKILIDCAEGTQMQLRKHGIKLQRIEHILISHLHGDHYFGLVGLLSTMHLLGREKPIHIYSPSALEAIVKMQLEAGGAKLAYDLCFHPLAENGAGVIFKDSKISIEHFPLSHKIETHGFVIRELAKERNLDAEKAVKDGVLIEEYVRLKKGVDVVRTDGTVIKSKEYTTEGDPELSYGYCSDTEYFEPIINHVKGVDLLYHEATFIESLRERAEATKHSTAFDAASIAKKANVGRLLMGHLSARYDSGEEHLTEALSVFTSSFVVEDGDKFVIGAK